MVLHLLQLLIYLSQVNMAETVNIKKTIYDAASFNEVVDTSFTQLVPQNPTINVEENNVLSTFYDYLF